MVYDLLGILTEVNKLCFFPLLISLIKFEKIPVIDEDKKGANIHNRL